MEASQKDTYATTLVLLDYIAIEREEEEEELEGYLCMQIRLNIFFEQTHDIDNYVRTHKLPSIIDLSYNFGVG